MNIVKLYILEEVPIVPISIVLTTEYLITIEIKSYNSQINLSKEEINQCQTLFLLWT